MKLRLGQRRRRWSRKEYAGAEVSERHKIWEGVARNLFRRGQKSGFSRSPAGSILTQSPRWGLGQSPQNTKNMLKIWLNVTNSILFRQKN